MRETTSRHVFLLAFVEVAFVFYLKNIDVTQN